MIFVFGSNLGGRHAGGAALHAHKHHGAVWGQGVGHHGGSYALPTMDESFQPLPLDVIESHVRAFMDYAAIHTDLEFQVTKVGCGIAGFTEDQIAPMFRGAPFNCQLPDGW